MALRKLLIANRAEVVGRIARSARSLGLQTVAVYSDADRDAWHIAQCDEAVGIGGLASRESYLMAEKLLAAAKLTGADAVHPGYGFLSENADFARSVIDAGLTWVGPSPNTIELMGDKIAAKRIMREAGVPTLPSAELDANSDLSAAAGEVGFPLLVKAAAGGGGKGMRLVHSSGEVTEAVASCRREAGAAFGDDRVFLERFMVKSRHIEVQIFGDSYGNLVHMFERECSIQRRHQKIIEESPSPVLTDAERHGIFAAALVAGRAIDYQNAGTVEFVRGEDGSFSFLEVNTRLQVEHPVTEAVTGVDLVALQLAIAAGEALPFNQGDLVQRGHAIEVRLYAEDPAEDYLPCPGTIVALERGDVPGVRWDAGVTAGSTVSQYYDPMIAKIIGYGRTREQAAAALALELQATNVQGIRTNQDLLTAVLRDDVFLRGMATTAYLEDYFPTNEDRRIVPEPFLLTFACCAVVVCTASGPADAPIPARWRNNPAVDGTISFAVGSQSIACSYCVERDGSWTICLDGVQHRVMARGAHGSDTLTLEIDRRLSTARLGRIDSRAGTSWSVSSRLGRVDLVALPRFPDRHKAHTPGAMTAPMPGNVMLVPVSVGDIVARGALICVIEAMKMELRLEATSDGVITDVFVRVGDQVQAGQSLVVAEAHE
jgi:propionyl-CoA carboxylase alpha chain